MDVVGGGKSCVSGVYNTVCATHGVLCSCLYMYVWRKVQSDLKHIHLHHKPGKCVLDINRKMNEMGGQRFVVDRVQLDAGPHTDGRMITRFSIAAFSGRKGGRVREGWMERGAGKEGGRERGRKRWLEGEREGKWEGGGGR